MKNQLDLIITGGDVVLPNSSIEKIDMALMGAYGGLWRGLDSN